VNYKTNKFSSDLNMIAKGLLTVILTG